MPSTFRMCHSVPVVCVCVYVYVCMYTYIYRQMWLALLFLPDKSFVLKEVTFVSTKNAS